MIEKNLWHTCAICNAKIQDLAKIYGGEGVYYVTVFTEHLLQEHNITPTEYFEKITARPICKCGLDICGKKSIIAIKKGSNFRWKDFICGRNHGILTWSDKARISRRGSGNPMFGKPAWNKNLTKENNEIVLSISNQRRGMKYSDETIERMSTSAKKRKIHGHTGKKHSDATKQVLREKTLQNIKRGVFKQTNTKPHRAFKQILDNHNINYYEEHIIDVWSFDFWLVDINLAVEVDGDYFHSNPKIYPVPKTKTQKINRHRDIKKDKFCKDNNISLVRFWESDILSENFEDIVLNTISQYTEE